MVFQEQNYLSLKVWNLSYYEMVYKHFPVDLKIKGTDYFVLNLYTSMLDELSVIAVLSFFYIGDNNFFQI